jgi:predicted dehydrogenase
MKKKTLTRRAMLRRSLTAAAALGFPHVIPASALGGPGRFAPSDRINTGFIGMGGRVMGRASENYAGLLKFFQSEEACVVRAVCDVNQNHLKAAQERVNQFNSNNDCLTFTDFRDLLARPDIDAVVIGTSHNWHGVLTVLSCRYGKDVYVEKPISNTIIEAKKMAQAAVRFGRIVQAGTQARSSPRFKYLVDVIQQGKLGKIKQVLIGCDGPPVHCNLPAQPEPDYLDWNMWVGPSPWRPYNQSLYNRCMSYIGFGGGKMTDWGQHFFDVAQWGLGTDHTGPTDIYPADGKEHEFITFKYAHGPEMIIHMKNGRQVSNGTMFIGEHGEVETIAWHDLVSFKPQHLAHQYFDHANKIEGNTGYLLGNHVTNFLDCVRTRKKPNADLSSSYRAVILAHLTNIAIWLNRPLKWDPEVERFVGDEEANRYLETVHRSPWVI